MICSWWFLIWSDDARMFLRCDLDMDKLGRVSERTVCDPFFKHATVGYVVTWLRPVTT